jgi:hypothetical protein
MPLTILAALLRIVNASNVDEALREMAREEIRAVMEQFA